MLEFDHIGLTSLVPRPGENWVEQSRCWVTNPHEHPERIEFLRYREDSPVPEVIRSNPHFAFRVDSLSEHIEGLEIIIPPFTVAGFAEVVFVRKYDAIFEYIVYLGGDWFGAGGS
ncbi:MAG: hypothetical protein OXB95_10055 [Rhodobacteraceae bacterium]|nr:hypothetical protein [Paracoccaceae bacterium]